MPVAWFDSRAQPQPKLKGMTMNKELEALLMMAAKGMSLGVVVVDKQRAQEFGVEPAAFVREGEFWGVTRAPTTGFYTNRGVDSLVIDTHSPGDGWTRYSVSRVPCGHTGHYSFSPHGMTLAEVKAFLRGVIVARTKP
jgi:hypothetical protein